MGDETTRKSRLVEGEIVKPMGMDRDAVPATQIPPRVPQTWVSSFLQKISFGMYRQVIDTAADVEAAKTRLTREIAEHDKVRLERERTKDALNHSHEYITYDRAEREEFVDEATHRLRMNKRKREREWLEEEDKHAAFMRGHGAQVIVESEAPKADFSDASSVRSDKVQQEESADTVAAMQQELDQSVMSVAKDAGGIANLDDATKADLRQRLRGYEQVLKRMGIDPVGKLKLPF
ncbi:MAG: hypothetical protein R3F54_25465 [Alphaproteobacteria bacterium]